MQLKAGKFTFNPKIRAPEKEEAITGVEGEKYAKRKDDRTLTYRLVAQDILEKTNPTHSENILEVACGAGQLAQNLFELSRNPNITATDASEELIKAAKEKYKKYPINFAVEDIHFHPGRGENDVVVIKDSFHHFKEPDNGMNDLLMLVKKGGWIYLFDLTRDAPIEEIKKRLDSIKDKHEKLRFLRSINASLTKKEMEQILSNCNVEYRIQSIGDFSKYNLKINSEFVKKDKTGELSCPNLFAIYLIQKL
jgi:ubiquinone/menaquinone biosynthesis C-methylase UbiE